VQLLLGFTEKQVLGQPITLLIPELFDEMSSFRHTPVFDFGDSGPVSPSSSHTHTPASPLPDKMRRVFFEGTYSGKALHSDHSELKVWYQVRWLPPLLHRPSLPAGKTADESC
jgi:hypothetical protein